MIVSLCLFLILLCPTYASSAPNPYVQATVEIASPEQVRELARVGIEPRGWVTETTLRIIGRQSDLTRVRALGFDPVVEISDLEEFYAAQMSGREGFGDYYTYAEAKEKMVELHMTYPAVTTEPESIGVSVEGNVLWAMKVSDNPELEEDEPEVLFTGIHHAREPIGCTLCLDFIELLASGYGSDAFSTFLVDERQIWFVPVVNPDGYLYNEATYPNGGGMWRKNRRDNGDGSHGVDLNRNYSYQWGYDNTGSSPYPSDETYRGPSPASEPETQVMIQFCIEHDFTCAQNWHSHGNVLIYPWGYNGEHTPDHEHFVNLATEATMGIGYDFGTCEEVLWYPANGDANDWMYGEQDAKPKIFATTAEVGENFWQESEIPNHIQEGREISIAFAKMGGPIPVFEALVIDDTDGNGNGRFDPGETGTLSLVLANIGFSASEQVTATVFWHDSFIDLSPTTSVYAPFPDLSTVSGTPFTVGIDTGCPQGYAAVCSVLVEGDGVYPDTLMFSIPVGQPYLLLVDSDDEPTEARLISELSQAGYSFASWDRPAQGAVPLSELRLYQGVVWTAGDQNTSSIPADDRASLAAYLDIGGALLLSAENYLTAYGDDPFTSDYLHIQSYTTSIDVSTVHGVPGDPVTDGVIMDVSFPGGMSVYPDAVIPDAQATGILTVDSGSQITAHRFPVAGSSVYRMIFTATPLEALHAGSTTLDELLHDAVDWLLDSSDDIPPSAPGDLTAALAGVPGQITLAWQEAADDVAVAHYRLYQSAASYFLPTPVALLEATADTTLSVEVPGPGEELYWRVTAVDAAGNESEPSAIAGATSFELVD